MQANPYVFILDCTYKVNKSNMPLMHYVGVSSVGTITFSSSFAFIDEENIDAFNWIIEQQSTSFNFPKNKNRIHIIDCDGGFNSKF